MFRWSTRVAGAQRIGCVVFSIGSEVRERDTPSDAYPLIFELGRTENHFTAVAEISPTVLTGLVVLVVRMYLPRTAS